MLDRIPFLFGKKMPEDSPAPSMDAMLDFMDRELENFDDLVPPAPESRPRTSFDSGLPISEVSLGNMNGAQRKRALPHMIPLMFNMWRSSRMYSGHFKPRSSQASPEFIIELERRARQLGAKDIAYVRVPQNAIFQGKGIPHPYAIVFTVEMEEEPIFSSPSFDSQLEVMRGYKNLAIIGNKIARFMHRAGYAAYPGTALGGITDYDYLAELAGLGINGYHGLLITPGEGARLRINTIYTNIENLPFADEEANPHQWVRDFCAMCRKCIRACPVDAIFDEPQPRGDGGMQCIDHATCRDYFTRNYGCAICLAKCPFSQVGYEAIKERFKGNPAAPQFVIPLETIPAAQVTYKEAVS